MKKLIITAFLLIVGFTTAFSQPYGHRKQKQELIDKERIPFFTNYLDLSPQEAEKFWPLYNEYLNKKQSLFKEMRSIKMKLKNSSSDISDTEAENLNKEYISIQEKQFELLREYNEKFKKILPINKVNKIYFAEREFRKYLLKQLRKNRRQ